MRPKIFLLIIIILFLLPLCGLFYIQIVRGNFYYRLSKKNYIRLIEYKAPRGKIVDRNGIVFADNEVSFNVALIPQELRDKENIFEALSEFLDEKKEELQKRFQKGYSTPFAPVVVKKNLEKKKAMLIEQKKLDLPGVIVEVVPQRFYPYDKVAAHITGYVGLVDRKKISRLKEYGYSIKDIVGYTGIEEYYDALLKGQDGGMQIEVDNQGRQVRVLAMRSSEKGSDIALTLDMRIQKIAYELLKDQRGAIVVMQPSSGEILAMVSSPSFDPNMFIVSQTEKKINRLFRDKKSPLLNRTISSAYPAGSVFKIIPALAALESKKISQYTRFVCNGRFTLGNAVFRCGHQHGSQDLLEAITHSCNVYFYTLGVMLGPDLMERHAFNWGFGSKTNIDLPFEKKGNVPSKLKKRLRRKESWYKGDSVNLSIGQGELLITPLQAARFISAIANGGWLVEPFLLRSLENETVVRRNMPKKIRVHKETLQVIRAALRKVVDAPTGTAHVLDMKEITVAGKTGTAQTSRDETHAWFVGYAPTRKPTLAFCIFLEHGGSSYNACVLAKSLLKELHTQGIVE
ncbi:penicillin-binding protein 2 [Candidatus Omnitrophota bacterium]